MMKRAIGVLAAAAAAALAAAAEVHAAGVTDTEIVLGTHLDLSGPVAAGMPQLRNGMQMRLDEANEAGGVNGRKFRLIVEDNGSQPQLAVRAVDKLINSDGVFAIVNAFGSGPNAATIKRAVDAKVLYYSPWGASAVLRKVSGNSPLLFTTTPDYDNTVGPALAWMIGEHKSQKVGFIYQEGPFGDLVRGGVNVAIKARNMTLAAEAGYKPGDIEFSSQVARMKAAGVDLILIATITRETVGVMSEIKKLGWNDVKVLTAIPGRTSIVAALGKANVEGLYGVSVWNIFNPGSEPAGAKEWAASFKKRFNLDPDENGMLAYAYTDWLVKAIAAAGKTVTVESVAAALAKTPTDHMIFFGKRSFQNGHITPEVAQVEQIKGGRWVPVSKPLN
jgi:ABC-type branched-subunit amino acid transport system substrate-binding protein